MRYFVSRNVYATKAGRTIIYEYKRPMNAQISWWFRGLPAQDPVVEEAIAEFLESIYKRRLIDGDPIARIDLVLEQNRSSLSPLGVQIESSTELASYIAIKIEAAIRFDHETGLIDSVSYVSLRDVVLTPHNNWRVGRLPKDAEKIILDVADRLGYASNIVEPIRDMFIYSIDFLEDYVETALDLITRANRNRLKQIIKKSGILNPTDPDTIYRRGQKLKEVIEDVYSWDEAFDVLDIEKFAEDWFSKR